MRVAGQVPEAVFAERFNLFPASNDEVGVDDDGVVGSGVATEPFEVDTAICEETAVEEAVCVRHLARGHVLLGVK